MEVSVAHTAEELKAIVPHWEELAAAASTPSIFYEPWFMLPALQHLDSENVITILVWESTPGHSTLLGLFPLERLFGYSGLPIRWYRLWNHLHCFLSVPMVRAGVETAVIHAFKTWLDSALPPGCFLALRTIPAEGAIYEAFKTLALSDGRLYAEIDSYERPSLPARTTEEKALILSSPSARRRKHYRTHKNKLAALGTVTFEILSNDSDLEIWISNFLTVESSGWKGKEQSTLALHPNQKTFFEEVIRNGWKRNVLQFSRLALNDRAVAMRVAFYSGNTLFACKVAYDETLGYASPGMLLEYELMQYFSKDSRAVYIDSCAAPDHPNLAPLWYGRRPICSADISLKHWPGKPVLQMLNSLRAFKRKLSRSNAHKQEQGETGEEKAETK